MLPTRPPWGQLLLPTRGETSVYLSGLRSSISSSLRSPPLAQMPSFPLVKLPILPLQCVGTGRHFEFRF